MAKQYWLTSSFALLMAFAGWGAEKNYTVMEASPVMKALPIYSNTLIDKTPEGKVVEGIRDCFSCYFQSGESYRGFENGVLGEYVVGDDGNVYLRGVCYSAAQISAATDTYLKLEKVDDTTYVAHTPQLIWVDELNEGTPFTAYATRVVFTQKSATSFSYEVQKNPDETYNTDIYFTLKDGKLSQKNQNTIEMNEEVFPEELIGFTNSLGGWLGFGDGCISIYPPESEPTTLPADAKVVEKSLDYNLLHVRDKVIETAELVKYAEVGDDLYISNPSAETEQWLKGAIDRKNGTVTFERQYLGIDDKKGYAVWLIPVKYDKYLEVFDDETGFGDWFRTYTAIDKLVLKYEDGKISTLTEGEALYFSHSSEELLMTGVYADPEIKEYTVSSGTPAPVIFTKYEPYDELWGFGVVGFAIPSMDSEGIYINPDELFYRVYPDDSKTPYLFSPEEYVDMEVEGMTEIPYRYYEDFDFKYSGVNHTFYFYKDWEKVGVQVIRKHDGKETVSAIVYSNGLSGIDQIGMNVAGKAQGVYKYVENGNIVIVRDGKKYTSTGISLE